MKDQSQDIARLIDKPFFILVVSFALGVVFEKASGLGWSAALLVVLVSLAIAAVLKFKKWRALLLFSLFLSMGILRMSFAHSLPDQNLDKLLGQKINLEAVISKEPDVRDIATRYTIKPDESESLVLVVANRFPEFQYGDKVKVSGKLEAPKNFDGGNGTEFDYISYLSKDDIHFMMYRPQIEKTGERERNGAVYFLYSIKNSFIKNISEVVPEPNASLLSGVIFGAKQSLGEDLLRSFREAGLIHMVVLSGYNITIIAAGIFYAVSFLGKRRTAFAVSAVSIVLFGFMVGLGATVVRACIMAIIAILARFLGRPVQALRALFVAGFIMVLWNPLILFDDPSFQLSFMATLGLILFSPFVSSLISAGKFQKILPVKFGIRETVSSTLAVQLFVLPLLARMSGFISLVSFIINPLVLPLVPWAMMLGGLTGALRIIPFLGGLLSWPFGALSYLASQIIISLTEVSAALPVSILAVGSVPVWAVLLWYSFYALLFFKMRAKVVSLS